MLNKRDRSAVRTYFLATLLAGGLLAGPALAQEDLQNLPSEDAATPTEDAASAEGEATAPASTKPSLDEVIVTAQRRAQNIKEVPISVTAIGEQQMEEMDMVDLNDLNRMAPTIKVGGAGVFNSIAIRGLGSGVNWGVDQAVGIFIDDVYYTGAERLSTSMMDISGIEILRGPQGTLFGRNTIAGAILIHTGDPEHEWGFAAEGNVGEGGRMDGNFMINAPIWDERIAARLAFRKGEDEGDIYDRLEGRGSIGEMRAVRAKLRFTPSEKFDLQFAVMDQKGRSEGTKTQYWNIQDEHLQLMRAFDPEAEGNLGDHAHSADTPDGGTEWQTDYTMRASLTALNHDFIFIGNYSDQHGIGSLDIDYGPIPLLRGTGDRYIDQHSLELRAVSNFGGWFEYVAGLYYFHGNRLHNTLITLLPVLGTSEASDALLPAIAGGLLGGTPPVGPYQSEDFFTRFDQQTDSYSIYGQMTADILEELTLIIGARYAIDQKSVDFKGTASGPGGAPTPGLLLNYSLGAENFYLVEDREDRAFDPKISVVYHMNDDINLYGTISSGHKNGGFNAQAWTSQANLQFEAESSISYELGMKGDFLEGAARLNIAAFRTEFKDLQASVWDGTTFIVDNAAAVTTQGVEVEGQIMLPWNIFAIGAFAYLDAKYDSFPNGPCVAGSDEDFCDVSGSPLPGASEFQANGSVNYVNTLGNLPLDAFIGIDMVWQSAVSFAADGDPLDTEEAYALFNGRIGLMGDDQNWNFMIYVRNLEDKVIKVASFDATLLTGTHVAYVSPPRTVSAQFSMHF